jgi:uncharacterized protein (TIGR03086 family)
MAPLNSGHELLDAAVGYALAGAAMATPPLLKCPTPCSAWDLGTLLDHLSDSIAVLGETIDPAGVNAAPAAPQPGRGYDPVTHLRGQATRLLASYPTRSANRMVAIADREITANVVAATAAIEMTVHGWDIFAACGISRPVPPDLAAALLPAAALLITPRTRPGLFADPVRLPGPASPGDQFVAFLGRQLRFPAAA